MSDSADGAAKGLGIFSVLESATQTNFFLLAATFLLLVDTSLIHFNHHGILDLINRPELMKPSLGLEVIVIFVGFSFLTSVLLPPVVASVNLLLIGTLGNAWISLSVYLKHEFRKNYKQAEHRPFKHVRPYELRSAAHEKKDSYLLALLAEHEKEIDRRWKASAKSRLYASYALIIVAANFFGYFGHDSQSLLQALNDHSGVQGSIWLIFAGLLFIIYFSWGPDSSDVSIYCPTLYEELEQRDRKRHGESSNWLRPSP